MQSPSVIDSAQYLESVKRRLSGYFDFLDIPAEYSGRLDLWAHYVLTDERYFLTRKVNLSTVNSHEFMAIRLCDGLTLDELNQWFDEFKGFVMSRGQTAQTICTQYTLAFVSSSGIDASVREAVSRLRFNKSFAFNFRGWVEIAVVAVDLTDQTVSTNALGKQQLESALWSFDGKPVRTRKKSIFERIPIFRCSCTG